MTGDTPDDTDTVPVDSEHADNGGDAGSDSSQPDEGSDSTGIGPEGITYVVKPGDMLMALAKRFYGDESKYVLIMEANNIDNADMIMVGQKLIIPPEK